MATALCDFGCSGTVELPAPDAMGHNCPVHTAKAFEAFSVFLRAQEWKAAITTDGPILSDGLLGKIVLPIAARADQMGRTFLAWFGIRFGSSCSHKSSGAVLNGRYLRTCSQALPVMLTRFQSNCRQGKFFCSTHRFSNETFISTCPQI